MKSCEKAPLYLQSKNILYFVDQSIFTLPLSTQTFTELRQCAGPSGPGVTAKPGDKDLQPVQPAPYGKCTGETLEGMLAW